MVVLAAFAEGGVGAAPFCPDCCRCNTACFEGLTLPPPPTAAAAWENSEVEFGLDVPPSPLTCGLSVFIAGLVGGFGFGSVTQPLVAAFPAAADAVVTADVLFVGTPGPDFFWEDSPLATLPGTRFVVQVTGTLEDVGKAGG